MKWSSFMSTFIYIQIYIVTRSYNEFRGTFELQGANWKYSEKNWLHILESKDDDVSHPRSARGLEAHDLTGEQIMRVIWPKIISVVK